MARTRKLTLAAWFDNSGGWKPRHDLAILEAGIAAGFTDAQDEYGMTALSSAVMSAWTEGVQRLLRAGADTELRHHRTGDTALRLAVVYDRNEEIIRLLLRAGAKPDTPNHSGSTPRTVEAFRGLDDLFGNIPEESLPLPEPLIQNAEHLADHYHPKFKIPDRDERESLQPGQAVSLYVYGPREKGKQDTVKVRITARAGRRPRVLYSATVETPLEETHLRAGTTEVSFGPEHVATVWVTRPARKRK